MEQGSSSEGVSSVSSAIKRGLSVDSGQEVKRFRTATGAISAVRTMIFFFFSPNLVLGIRLNSEAQKLISISRKGFSGLLN